MSIHAPRWRAPVESASKISLPQGETTPQFEIQRFGSSFKENLKEWLRPAAFKSVRKKDSAFGPPQAIALALHAGVVMLIFLPLHHLSNRTEPPGLRTYLIAPDISPYKIKMPPGKDKAGGGGGGGDRSPLPATKGRAPKFMLTQIAPPSIPRNENPRLVAEASLLGPPELQFPSPNLNIYGDPLANAVNDSGGPGDGGGMGNGKGPGIGNGHGPGLGPGEDGGYGGNKFKPGSNGVGYPTCVYCPDAKYSEEARKAKFQGTVLLQVIVSPDGRATNIQIVRGPGLGLDDEAIAAVKTWRFKPALGPNRVPVATEIDIEVNFRLL
jgi:protein TonB